MFSINRKLNPISIIILDQQFETRESYIIKTQIATNRKSKYSSGITLYFPVFKTFQEIFHFWDVEHLRCGWFIVVVTDYYWSDS